MVFHIQIFKICYNDGVRKDRDIMKCNIRGEKIKVTDSIKNYIETKLSKLDKYFKSDVSSNVLIKLKGNKEVIEVTIPYDKYILRSSLEHDDLYAAIDLVSDKLERQIRKNKTKMKKQIKTSEEKINSLYEEEIVEEEENDDNTGRIVKREYIEMKPISDEEAILQLDLVSTDFYVYRNRSNRLAVIYRRKDGNYEVIETSE